MEDRPPSVFQSTDTKGRGELSREFVQIAASKTPGPILFAIFLAGLAPSACVDRDYEETAPLFAFSEQNGGKLLLREGDSPVFVYNYGVQTSSTAPSDRERSSYVHPLFDLEGNSLTDDFPQDHFHHRGLSWMWPNVWVGDKHYDLWHIQGLYQRFDSWLAQEVSDADATLGVDNAWVTDQGVVADEKVWIRAFRGDEHGRAIDVSLTWKALEEPIRIRGADERAYGGLCLRLAPREDAVITSPEGVMESDSDLVPLPWADQSGRFGSGLTVSGVSIFQAPTNPEFPAGWCLRYYGFLGVSWPGERVYTLKPGESLTLSFRIWVHRGDWKEGHTEGAFRAFMEKSGVEFPKP